MVQSLWGAANISELAPVPAGEVEPPPKPVLLKLECRFKPSGVPCGTVWEAETFTECPKCRKRRFVHKVEEAVQAV